LKEKRKIALIILLLVLLAGGSYWAYNKYFMSASSSILATGTIEATTVDLNLKAAGTIKTLAFKEGDAVKQNQPLAELTRSDLAAQRERDALAVAEAQDKVNDLVSGARDQEIKAATASLNIAKINLDNANLDLERVKKLFEAGAVSQQELDQAQLNSDLKKNQLDAAQAALSLLQAGTRPAQISGAEAEVERTKAVLKASESMLDDLKINSPIDGIVLSRNYEPGEFVAMGVSLGTIADLNHLWIKVYIPTDDLPMIKLGQKVHFTVSGNSTQYIGTVSNIASQGEFTPKTIQTKQERTNVVFAVKITVDDNQNSALKPGMPADVVFDRS
jgi:HlyD family secretion protein